MIKVFFLEIEAIVYPLTFFYFLKFFFYAMCKKHTDLHELHVR